MLELCRHKELDESQFVRFRQLVEDEEEVDINCTDDLSCTTPLISLCCYNHGDGLFDCVHLLLQRPDIQINQTSEYGRNALMKLCWCSTSEKILEVAQLLINKGIDINQTTGSGSNALMALCGLSRNDKILEVAQLLISSFIKINQTDKRGWNALIWLCWLSENDKIVEVAQFLIASGIKVNQTDFYGENAATSYLARRGIPKKQEVIDLLRR